MTYPDDWPRCPRCGKHALDGHITCGSVECNESEARRERTSTEFSVCQFFPDGGYEYVCRWVTAEKAFEVFQRMTQTLGARLGTTVRVIITDGGDMTNAEWTFGEGLTYPKRAHFVPAKGSKPD